MDNGIESKIIEKCKKASKRLVLLDYDGTLVNYVRFPDAAVLPDHINQILFSLHDDPKTKIYIITGRRHTDIDRLLNHTSINIIAEHGAMIKENGLWRPIVYDNVPWKPKVLALMNKYTLICPGSFIEEKDFSITWHYRNSDNELGYEISRKIIESLKHMADFNNLKLLDGKKVIEVLTKAAGKGEVLKKLFDINSYDFVLAIGDDVTDEEMFNYLKEFRDAITIKVGEGDTAAIYKFEDINNVAILLKQLLG
jgi:trehalose 6-phosphate synthase/phosphatase